MLRAWLIDHKVPGHKLAPLVLITPGQNHSMLKPLVAVAWKDLAPRHVRDCKRYLALKISAEERDPRASETPADPTKRFLSGGRVDRTFRKRNRKGQPLLLVGKLLTNPFPNPKHRRLRDLGHGLKHLPAGSTQLAENGSRRSREAQIRLEHSPQRKIWLPTGQTHQKLLRRLTVRHWFNPPARSLPGFPLALKAIPEGFVIARIRLFRVPKGIRRRFAVSS